MQLAEKALKGGWWPRSKERKMRNALNHYIAAANKFKTAKQYAKAANAFEIVADTHLELKNSWNDVHRGYKDAGVQYKLAKNSKCMEMFDKAATVLCDQGKHSQAAKMLQQMAEVAAKDKEYEQAVMHYKKAAGLYESDDYPVQANRCREKVAIYQVEDNPPDFSEAAEIFEDLGRKSLESRLGRHGARKHFFKASICILAAGDCVLAREKMDTYERLDPSLARSREGKLIKQLVEATEAYDVKALATYLQAYNEITEFDQWHIRVLTAVRKHIDPDMDTVKENDTTPESSTSAAAPALPSANLGASHSDSPKSTSTELDVETSVSKSSPEVSESAKANKSNGDDGDDSDDDDGG